MSRLELKNICKNFDDFVASKDISFVAEEGEMVTLLGPSGCGKTTLLKMIGGFHTPDSGEILIGDENITNVSPEKRNTSMCFQSYALFPHLSVEHNIAFGLNQKGVAKAEQIERVQEAVAQVDLGEHSHKMPSELSGGQQQRVALARAMVTRPAVILFDEPLSNLDAKLRESVRFEIRELQKRYNLTAIYVTHDQAEALAMSDKIVVLNRGRIEQIGTPEDIYYRPANRFVADFIGAANILPAQVNKTEQANTYSVTTEIGDFIVESDEPPKSDNIFVCWRPEDARLAEDSDINRFQVRVNQMAFMGNVTDLLVESLNDVPLEMRIQLPKQPKFQDNQLTFSLPKTGIRFLEEVPHD
ncbi:ABC transporter ATP-binding protein [Vibrio barjaei]|jgi:ABC-type Fe3+/spermidine/putrescine transport system ATPase subunit|uniref:ABC transporter ATP-binding protein n=1 Tax=Vibrio barjaei TaxID=1676683 RepID=UPI0007BBF44D|nr:ABC transporter ATP-binding protein [Vibrio barjaei]OIN26958.1 ABC transporter ATP-binding protein [Vibrio barjaei]